MTTWFKDAADNKCSVEYFGSKEAAQAAQIEAQAAP